MTEDTETSEANNVVPLNVTKKAPVEQKVLTQKWGEDTMKANYTVIPSALIRGQARLGIDAMEFAVLVHLLDHWWQADKMPWPSKKVLAERLRVSLKTIQRALVRLEKGGLLKRNARFDKKTHSRTSNEYDLTPLVQRLLPIAQDMLEAADAAKKLKKQAERPGLKTRRKKETA